MINDKLRHIKNSLYGDINPLHWQPNIPTSVDFQGWNSYDPNFNYLISTYKPKLIIEVGSWKGASAINMAQIAETNMLNTGILCVDTWLGSAEMWQDKSDETRYDSLRIQNGYPALYNTFLQNVISSGQGNRILPFPQTSEIACRVLKHYGVRADMVYLDASHDYDSVFKDLVNWYDILKKGGIIFGDDYGNTVAWPGVKSAVDDFAQINLINLNGFVALKISESGNQFMIFKP